MVYAMERLKSQYPNAAGGRPPQGPPALLDQLQGAQLRTPHVCMKIYLTKMQRFASYSWAVSSEEVMVTSEGGVKKGDPALSRGEATGVHILTGHHLASTSSSCSATK